jgi:preprotein translocase subunit SecB
MEESKFKFHGYRISKIYCEIKDTYGIKPEKMSQHIEVNHVIDNENSRIVVVNMNVRITSQTESILFELLIKGVFEAEKDMPEDLFKTLYSVNAPAILYPYVRAIVSSYTAQANIPAVIPPLMNFTQPK